MRITKDSLYRAFANFCAMLIALQYDFRLREHEVGGFWSIEYRPTSEPFGVWAEYHSGKTRDVYTFMQGVIRLNIVGAYAAQVPTSDAPPIAGARYSIDNGMKKVRVRSVRKCIETDQTLAVSYVHEDGVSVTDEIDLWYARRPRFITYA